MAASCGEAELADFCVERSGEEINRCDFEATRKRCSRVWLERPKEDFGLTKDARVSFAYSVSTLRTKKIDQEPLDRRAGGSGVVVGMS